jgi:rhodanese-related sulfurtransferase
MVNEIDSESLHTRLDSGERLRLLDIRSESEVSQGILPGAEHLPMHLIPLRLTELPKHEPLVLYCRSGARSYHACAYLKQQGYDNVINLRGGILAWARHGFDIVYPEVRRRFG